MYKTDDEIAASYRNYKIIFSEFNSSKKSGTLEIDFPYKESVIDNFIIYEDGRIAFDHWYPEKIYLELCKFIKDKLYGY